jgi:hypothetical protein
MYGKFLLVVGVAFILFVFSMFVGHLFRSGFSGIIRYFISILLIAFSIVTLCIIVGILIYSFIHGSDPLDTAQLLAKLLQEEFSNLW